MIEENNSMGMFYSLQRQLAFMQVAIAIATFFVWAANEGPCMACWIGPIAYVQSRTRTTVLCVLFDGPITMKLWEPIQSLESIKKGLRDVLIGGKAKYSRRRRKTRQVTVGRTMTCGPWLLEAPDERLQRK
jgi:hypothetical protein